MYKIKKKEEISNILLSSVESSSMRLSFLLAKYVVARRSHHILPLEKDLSSNLTDA